eukprot:CAMPEP_0178381350 /NCGR_PEP_ID=MMETSP0689_2-20121128/5934_1 /TAXON_ID=160604 /ORGANISM="Amphidinium massartii, Strain CS-259" /LENGTH=1105 /DNA_ID=CAMNT_0020001523 /DNA_START=53 /DNA_END=3370 /DNA_ORIENTATION=-
MGQLKLRCKCCQLGSHSKMRILVVMLCAIALLGSALLTGSAGSAASLWWNGTDDIGSFASILVPPASPSKSSTRPPARPEEAPADTGQNSDDEADDGEEEDEAKEPEESEEGEEEQEEETAKEEEEETAKEEQAKEPEDDEDEQEPVKDAAKEPQDDDDNEDEPAEEPAKEPEDDDDEEEPAKVSPAGKPKASTSTKRAQSPTKAESKKGPSTSAAPRLAKAPAAASTAASKKAIPSTAQRAAPAPAPKSAEVGDPKEKPKPGAKKTPERADTSHLASAASTRTIVEGRRFAKKGGPESCNATAYGDSIEDQRKRSRAGQELEDWWANIARSIPRTDIEVVRHRDVGEQGLVWTWSDGSQRRETLTSIASGGAPKQEPLSFGRVRIKVTVNPDVALVLVSDSTRYLFTWWYFFLDKVSFAAGQNMALYLWTGELPSPLDQPPEFCQKSVDEKHLKDRTKKVSSHHAKMPAILLALDAPGIRYAILVDMDAVFTGYSGIELRHFLRPPNDGCGGSVIFAAHKTAAYFQAKGSVLAVRNDLAGRKFVLEWLANRCGFKDQHSLWHVILKTLHAEQCLKGGVYPLPDGRTVWDFDYNKLLMHLKTLPISALDFDTACVHRSIFRFESKHQGVKLCDDFPNVCDPYLGGSTVKDKCALLHLGHSEKDKLDGFGKPGTMAWHAGLRKQAVKMAGKARNVSKMIGRQRPNLAPSPLCAAAAQDGDDDAAAKLREPVPFYIFDEEPLNVFQQVKEKFPEEVKWYKKRKHGGELWFIEAALEHPWRVRDWKQAKMYILPFPLGFCSKHRILKPSLSDGYDLCGEMVKKALRALKETEVYKHPKRKRNMFILLTDWLQRHHTFEISNFIMGAKRPGDPDMGQRCSVVVPMVSMLPTPEWASVSDDVEQRPIRTFFMGQTVKENYVVRRFVENFLVGATEDTVRKKQIDLFVTTVPKGILQDDFLVQVGKSNCSLDCEVTPPGCINCVKVNNTDFALMRQAKFGLHLQGDVDSSNRIYDILTAGSIPIVLGEYMYTSLPFQELIPWRSVVIDLPEAPFDVTSSVCNTTKGNALEIAKYAEARKAVQKYAPQVLWPVDPMAVTTNVLLTAHRECIS